MNAFLAGILGAFKEIGASFFKTGSTWWFLTPLLILWVVLEVYFGKYKKEKLGWNTSLANGISMVWVNIESMRFLFSEHPEPFWLRFILVFLILLYGVFIIYISFSHKFSEKVTYALAAPTPVYFMSIFSVLWGHGNLILSWYVILDLLILYPAIMGLFMLFRRILPEAESEIESSDTSLGSGLDDLGSSSSPGNELDNTKFDDLKF